MTVSNEEFGLSQDRLVTGWRLGHETRAFAATLILGVDAMPVQFLLSTGAQIVKLPLAAPNGRIFVIVNAPTGGVLTITDSADAAIVGGTVIASQTGIYQKVGAVYLKWGELINTA